MECYQGRTEKSSTKFTDYITKYYQVSTSTKSHPTRSNFFSIDESVVKRKAHENFQIPSKSVGFFQAKARAAKGIFFYTKFFHMKMITSNGFLNIIEFLLDVIAIK